MNRKKILDILLLPTEVYSKISVSKLSLYVGIILLGIIDMSSRISEKFGTLFFGRPSTEIVINIFLSLAFIVVVGIIDVVFFSVPLCDLFKRFKEPNEIPQDGSLRIKLMKIQIISNFIVLLPVKVLEFFALNINLEKSPAIAELFVLAVIVLLIWQTAVVARGVNTIFSMQPPKKFFVFPIIFLWNFILSFYSMSYLVDGIIMNILK